ncbi:MAG: CpaF family protein [Actinobacteria bacterium]|nr:CpaF family protein [Actinomycetota bacterium]NCW47410.1 CpaF family protein [Actinomycetota bacterium]NCW75743.1 CpaF family protein [Actinomycetota bacterium]NCX00739.1 CpaF family protein [Actinomycetota bacterium]NDA39988.1 CpaF family protein [Actinomycetota bacterium]
MKNSTLRDAIGGGAPERIDFQELKDSVHRRLLERLGSKLYTGDIEPNQLEELVYESVSEEIDLSERSISNLTRANLVQEVVDEVLGIGPIQQLLRNSRVTEIMVNQFDKIYYEEEGRLHRSNLAYSSEEHLRRTIERIVANVGRRIDESSPLVDARLPDGSRVNAVVPPISIDGATLTIRKFAAEPFSTSDLIDFGTLTDESTEFLNACVQARLNILISGGTGSGKTTTLSVLSSLIPEDERIITVEDAAELRLNQPHVIRLESRPVNIEGEGLVSVRDLVRNALRMRPDRIVVGEVRDGAALDMLQAMNTGHDGSLTTLHANSPKDALIRLENLVLMAGIDIPLRAIREQIVEAIDLIIHQARMRDGSRRIVNISEITGIDQESIQLQEIFRFSTSAGSVPSSIGSLVPTGLPLNRRIKFELRDVALPKGR